MQSVVIGYGLLGTEADDKPAGTLALGKNVVVTGFNGVFSFSIGDCITISSGALVETTGTAKISDGSYVSIVAVVLGAFLTVSIGQFLQHVNNHQWYALK